MDINSKMLVTKMDFKGFKFLFVERNKRKKERKKYIDT